MSKRLKNYPDPIEVVDKYGADALRWVGLVVTIAHMMLSIAGCTLLIHQL